jgi:1-acyl-sn-glycerol-3-phosphate acyltransferase
MRRQLRILYTYGVIVPVVALASVAVLAITLFGLPRAASDFVYRAVARIGLSVAGVRVRAVRWRVPTESLPPRLVVVANHESHLDTLLLLHVLGRRSVRFVAKRELFAFPIFGWALWISGNVAVTRGNTVTDVARLSDTRARRRDADVLFFPEGTRSPDGTLGPFKKGAFAFAVLNERPILPIGIAGTHERLPARELAPQSGDVAVVVGEPIAVSGLRYADREVLRERVRDTVVELRREARGLGAAR